MQSKIGILPKTLDATVVKECLNGVCTLNDSPASKDLYLVVGGTAVQSYIPAENRRPTSDIDLCIVKPLNSSTEFKLFAQPVMEYLKDKGYGIETKKANSNFKLIASKDGDGLVIEFSRRNPRKFKEMEKRLERELENGRRKTIQSTDVAYLVASPEDIAVPKIVRGLGTFTRHPYLINETRKVFPGGQGYDLKRLLSYVIGERAVAQESKEPEKLEKARLSADIYDMVSLSAFAGFNGDYMRQVMGQWDILNNSSKEKKLLFSFTNLIV